MRRALDLAKLGLGNVSPNPLVGCVITFNDEVIGEGWHQQYGGPHAEVNAVNSVTEKHLIPQSTVYVTLEPCSHHGKTPPCADMLISYGVKRVVIGIEDPNPLVAGEGIQRMRNAGIEVDFSQLEEECRQINRRFFVNKDENRPYVILKWAQTADGFIARPDGSSKWISSAESGLLVHKWRAEEDAILVGTRTAAYDDPSLTVRTWSGRNPLRIVLDRKRSLSESLKLFSDGVKTICYTDHYNGKRDQCEWIGLGEGFTVRDVISDLYRRGVGSLLVEGGAVVHRAFIDAGLWDEARIFTSAEKFGSGIAAPAIPAHAFMETVVYTDRLLYFKNH